MLHRFHWSPVFCVLLVLFASEALALGGHGVRIADLDNPEPLQAVDVAATDAGVIFATMQADTTQAVLNVYRSDDGGTTWDLWAELGTLYAEGEVDQAEMAIARGVPGLLAIGWIDRNTAGGSAVRFSTIDVDAAAPTWTHTLVDTDGGSAVSGPEVSMREQQTGDVRASMAWRRGADVRYATSGDGGATWSTPINAYSVASLPSLDDIDLAVDDLGVVHLVYGRFDFFFDVGDLIYGRAVNNGEDPSDWATEVVLATGPEDRRFSRVTVAADPDGAGVVAAGWVFLNSPAFTSDDAGLNWTPVAEDAGFSYPEAAWGAAGPYVVGVDSEPGTRLFRAIQSPVGAVDGPWTVERVAPYLGSGPISDGGIAVDPSRGGAPMIVYTQAAYAPIGSDEGRDLWFDAAWRDAPGFGVPDPFEPVFADSGAVVRAPLPGDLDGDGALEIVFTEASSATVHTIRWRGRADADDDFVASDVHPVADVALLDVDGDGDLEVFYFDPNGSIVGRQGDGSLVAGYPLDLGLGSDAGWINGSSIDGTTAENVVIAANASIWVLGSNAAVLGGFPFVAPGAAGQANGRPALGDVDGNGTLEIVAPFEGGTVILDRDGQVVAVLGSGGPAPGTPSLADIDGDGDLEIAIPREDGTVALVAADGSSVTPAWPYDTGSPGMPSQVALADVAGDARRDLVFTASDRVVHLVTPTGFVPAAWPGPIDAASALNDPVVDILGTGSLAVAIGGANGVMQVRRSDGAQEGWSRDFSTAITGSASVAYLDGDGGTDLIVPTADALWILDMGVASVEGTADWPISGFDVGRTGWVDRAAIVETSVASTPAPRLWLDAAPNPFNPRTVVRFRLHADGEASLRVLDARGRLVRVLHEGSLGAGEHAFVWSGDDDAGRGVASGVYFVQLTRDGERVVRRVSLVR